VVRLAASDLAMSRDTSFYYSFLVLPPRKRAAIIAVWDFCRAVDDAVDEVVPEHEWKGGLTTEARARAQKQVTDGGRSSRPSTKEPRGPSRGSDCSPTCVSSLYRASLSRS
jgi:phytoene/squalene synthetase